MKVIFLDHDGVICLRNNWGSRFKTKQKFDTFDEKAVKVLNEILEATDCEIVVSSDWRLFASLEEMQELYRERGIGKVPVGYTPRLSEFDSFTFEQFSWKGWQERIRILEIEQYLKLHPEVTHWVAVDDLDMSPEGNQGHGLENFVLTPRFDEGIKQCGIKEKIVKYFEV